MAVTRRSARIVIPAAGLPEHEIQIWFVSLRATDEWVRYGVEILSPDERARAGAFAFKRYSDEFTIGRASLRILLSRYCGLDCAKLEFQYGRRGKPSISHLCPSLRFNMSHSSGLAVYAIASGCELGIDLEGLRDMPDLEEIASRYFCAEEYCDLINLPQSARQAAFTRCWTRKEAFIKALGDGLFFELDRFRVAVKPEEAPRLLHIDGNSVSAGQWSLCDVAAPPGMTCCLAYSEGPRTIEYRPAPACVIGFDVLAS
jgi:4'-phosphopantetheinyl transferase